ncbi:MAG: hypothetical protein MJ116_02445 [Lachnospiraceae bacterium]|nr:hypothetical protein [Lachnospiraceae bacterium]
MAIKQLSIFVENKTGSLVKATEVLAEAGVDLRAMSIADTRDFGILRIIVNDTYAAVTALKDNGFVVNMTDVVGCVMADKPGAAGEMFAALSEAGIAIKYMYGFAGKTEAYAILRVDDNTLTEKILISKGIKLLVPERL